MGRRRLDERRRLRVERYLLTLRRYGHQPQLEDSTMSTETEALICDCPAIRYLSVCSGIAAANTAAVLAQAIRAGAKEASDA